MAWVYTQLNYYLHNWGH
uniref:Uncharacterized protein n=1 Tax=Anguilla anguilla TaxID=7936 RepID=A0A0E9TDC4_ANGAN